MKNPPVYRIFGLALFAFALTGCINPDVPKPAPPPPPPSVSTPDKPAYTVSEKAEAMKISLEVAAANDASEAFAADVRETAVTALRGRKFQVVADDSGDLELTLSARHSLYDKTGEYISLDGTVSARLDDTATKNILAEKTFRGRNKASLGMDKAVVDLAAAMQPEIAKWIGETVTPEQIPLEVRTLRISRIDRYPKGESAFIDAFVAAVSGMKGVLRCETASRDAETHTATFRVLYRRADYPQGFIHAAILRNPSLNLVLK